MLTNSSPECNLLYEPEEIEIHEYGALIRAEGENRDSGDPLIRSVSDLTIYQSRVASHVEKIQEQDLDRPKATKTHARQDKGVIENHQYRQSARQQEMYDLRYFKRVHLLPSRKLRARNKSARWHWASGALTQNRLVTSFMKV